jgi:hypothetical protein
LYDRGSIDLSYRGPERIEGPKPDAYHGDDFFQTANIYMQCMCTNFSKIVTIVSHKRLDQDGTPSYSGYNADLCRNIFGSNFGPELNISMAVSVVFLTTSKYLNASRFFIIVISVSLFILITFQSSQNSAVVVASVFILEYH